MPIPKAVNTRFAKDICLRAIMCNITMKITNTIILISVRKAFMNVTPQILNIIPTSMLRIILILKYFKRAFAIKCKHDEIRPLA